MSETQKEAYEILLLGQNINVKTHLNPEEIRQLVVLIEDQVSTLKKQNSNLTPQKLHLLALMAVAEKYIFLRTQVESFRKELSSEIATLKDYLERFLKSEAAREQPGLPLQQKNDA